MDEQRTPAGKAQGDWRRLAALDDLRRAGRFAVRADGRQIALFEVGGKVFACDNRCPHEGYPLTEGHVTEDAKGACLLTCNWHNWKFDLADGRTVMGGDDLTVYPVEVRDGAVWADLSGPSASDRRALALKGLAASFDRHEYGRMARELARLRAAGGDLLDGFRQTIRQAAPRFEYGTSHAAAAAADWMELYREFQDDPARALTAVLEAVGHFAWDIRREPLIPYARAERPFSEQGFLAALESEDEESAIAQARGALAAGRSFHDLEPVLARAALAHYQDFGHSLIYVYKTGQLIDRLGNVVTEPLLLMLVRSLAVATREDLIPQFRAYGEVLAAANGEGMAVPDPRSIRSGGLRAILVAIARGLGRPLETFDAAMEAASWQMLHFDTAYQDHTDMPLAKNVGWLSFTHALTFGNSVRALCTRTPGLWPQGLLQLGCFLGRNAGFVDADLDEGPWRVGDGAAFLQERRTGLFDHGQFEYIVAAHLVKLVMAMDEEFKARPEAPWVPLGLAALNRFLSSPLKRKHALRTARQAIDFVAREDVESSEV